MNTTTNITSETAELLNQLHRSTGKSRIALIYKALVLLARTEGQEKVEERDIEEIATAVAQQVNRQILWEWLEHVKELARQEVLQKTKPWRTAPEDYPLEVEDVSDVSDVRDVDDAVDIIDSDDDSDEVGPR